MFVILRFNQRVFAAVGLCCLALASTRGDEVESWYVPGTVGVEVEPAEVRFRVRWQLVEQDQDGEWVIDDDAWLTSIQTAEAAPSRRYGVACRVLPGWVAPAIAEVQVVSGHEVVAPVEFRRASVFATVAEITPQTVQHGDTLSLGIGEVASVTFEGERDIALEDGVFRYRPTSEERTQFTVTFTGASGENNVVFTPVGRLSPEHSVIEYRGDFPYPEAAERVSFLNVIDELSASARRFNYQDQPVRAVTVAGPRLVFQRGHEQRLFQRLCYAPDQIDNDNVATLELYADQVVIRGRAHFPSTNVTIYARELIFEDAGGDVASIVTTPVDQPPAADANPDSRLPGNQGDRAGNLTLNVARITAPPLTTGPRAPGAVVLDFQEADRGLVSEIVENGFRTTWVGFGDRPTLQNDYGNHVLRDYSRNNQLGAEVVITTVEGASFFFEELDYNNLEDNVGRSDEVIRVSAYPAPSSPDQRVRSIDLKPTSDRFDRLTSDQLDLPPGLELDRLSILIFSKRANYTVDNIALRGVSRSSARLVVAGGDGQNSEAGRNGAPLEGFRLNILDECCSAQFPAGHIWYDEFEEDWRGRVIYAHWNRGACFLCFPVGHDEGSLECPRSGLDAVSDGSPGRGGSGGHVSSPFDVRAIAVVDAGRAGRESVLRFGSRAEGPENAIRVRRDTFCVGCGWGPWYVLEECGNTDGVDRGPVAPNGPRPTTDGQFVATGPLAWIHPVTVRTTLEFARAAFLNGYPEVVRALLEPYAAALRAAVDLPESLGNPDHVTPSERHQLELAQLHNEVLTILDRVRNGLDYFGYPAGWVPMLSFEVSQSLFENEVEAAGDIFYVTWYLQQAAQDAVARAAALTRLRGELSREFDELADEQVGMLSEFDELYARAAALDQEIRHQGGLLRTHEAALEARGQLTLGVKKAMRTAANALRAVPYQGGLLQVGLSAASRFNEQSAYESVVDGVNLAGQLIQSEVSDIQSDISTFTSGGEPTVGATLLVIQRLTRSFDRATEGLFDTISEFQSWDRDLEREVEILAAQDPSYREIVAEIDSLTLFLAHTIPCASANRAPFPDCGPGEAPEEDRRHRCLLRTLRVPSLRTRLSSACRSSHDRADGEQIRDGTLRDDGSVV